MSYLYIKAFHIVAMVTWFAGLFYIVRLYIYLVEAEAKPEPEKSIVKSQLLLMAGRLWYAITVPGMLATVLAGVIMLWENSSLLGTAWFQVKLAFLAALLIYHFYTGHILLKLRKNTCRLTSMQLRMYNELPTLFLFAIVFLAVLKNTLDMFFGIGAFFVLLLVLVTGIKIYKKIRAKS